MSVGLTEIALEVSRLPDSASAELLATDTEIIHCRSYEPDRYLCGARRDPAIPTRWGTIDCVVCLDLAPPGSPGYQLICDHWMRLG